MHVDGRFLGESGRIITDILEATNLERIELLISNGFEKRILFFKS